MSQLTERVKAKYPQYQNIPDAQLEQMVLAKYPQYKPLATNTIGDMLGKVGNGVMYALNAPSYAIGGVMKGRREALQQGDYRKFSNLFNDVKSVAQGLKEKTPVMQELPALYGIDPNSTAGIAVGLGGELLTPSIPITKIVGKGAGIIGKVTGLNKLGVVGREMAQTLLQKSYKLSATDIEKIAEAIGATDEATKAQKVFDYLEKQGLQGATQSSLNKLNDVINPIQQKYDSLTRTGKVIDPKIYASQIMAQAQEILSNPLSSMEEIQLAEKLKAEAERFSSITTPIIDTMLTEKKSGAFAGIPQSKINDPYLLSKQKSMGVAGINALEQIAPGSKETGKQLRGLRTTSEVLGKKANTGLGSQLINSFKPSALGFGVGAGYGAYSGQNPLESGLLGAVAGVAANNPTVMNKAGKTMNALLNAGSSPVIKTIGNIGARAADTAIRSPGFTKQPDTNELPHQSQKILNKTETQQSYTPSIALPSNYKPKAVTYKSPKNMFKNNSAFGKIPKIRISSSR